MKNDIPEFEACPTCGTTNIDLLDSVNKAYRCINGHRWRLYNDTVIPLEKLSLGDTIATVAMNPHFYEPLGIDPKDAIKMAWDGVIDFYIGFLPNNKHYLSSQITPNAKWRHILDKVLETAKEK